MMLPRIRTFTMLAAVVVLSLQVSAQTEPYEVTSAEQWSRAVWQSALAGDRGAVDRHFKTLPDEVGTRAGAEHFRDSLTQYAENLDRAQERRLEDRNKAYEELKEHTAAGDLSKSLRSAVTVQTLSENLDDAFADPEIQKVLTWAQMRISEVEQDHDWLLVQELLYYVRTLYEDTSHVAEYQKYDDSLESVNRRVSLLAQYAPRHLFSLRAKRAERLGEPPIGEYRPNLTNDWRERIKGITPQMLKAALRTAAREHIEGDGWRPLLRGGLEEMILLATTASLDESFPKLADRKLVDRWARHIHQEIADLEATDDDDLDPWTLSRVLDELLRVNQQTVELPHGVIYREFGEGATFELDEFTEVIWPDRLSRFRQATEGAFVGVGILIRHNDAQEIVVVNPLEGEPAYYGGVKPNDIISEVDGESTVGWTLNDAVDRITGKPDTKVTLGLRRENQEELVNITLQRERIKLRSVSGWWKRDLRADGSPDWDWFVDPDSRIAYIKLTQFTEETHRDLTEAWKEITAKGKPTGLILDLRYNPGGLLTSAVQVSNLFLREGLIVSGEDKEGHRAWADQRANPVRAWDMDGIASIVLINQGSASASEIVAGCLQAHGKALVVGERSYGKGSVQTVHTTASTARMKLTTQYYRLPPMTGEERGRLVHKRPGATIWGVDPDLIVKMTPQQVSDSLELRQKADILPLDEAGNHIPDAEDRPDIHQMLTEGFDPQLETAVLLLQARALGLPQSDTRHASRQ